MATQSAEEKLRYLLTVFKNTELAQPDYHAVAADTGINSANTAQKKFKAIIESAGFKLVNKQIVPQNGSASVNTSTPSNPKAKRNGAVNGTSKKTPAKKSAPVTPKSTSNGGSAKNKKRKVEQVADSDEEDEEIELKHEDGEGINGGDESEVEVVRGGLARSTTIKAEEGEMQVDEDAETESE